MASKSSKTLLGRQAAPSVQVQKLLAEVPEGKLYDKRHRAVLFTDIVGSTAFFEQRGDEAGMAMVEQHNALLFPIIRRHDGIVIKTIGDAIMASFDDAASAVQAGVGMQAELKNHNLSQPPEERIRVRIGINSGEVICLDGDLFGDVVNAAARVESLARGEQILISAQAARELPEDFPFLRHLYDAVRVRGKQEPMEIFRVDWDPDAPAEDAVPGIPVEIGQRLGERFEILELLGEGGMGQVIRAKDLALDEEVALKFMRPDLVCEPDTLERFKSEIRLARSVTHPHICRIHEFLEMGGQRFLSMELIRGQTVEDQLSTQGHLNPAQVEHILKGVCTALQAAHDKGIIHRDLKPANIMIERETQRVVLMDFGIAGLSRARAARDDGTVAGTPDYMSPEQVRGESLGPESDLYSLGVILYQLVSGRLPHQADTPMAVAIQHVTEEPVPIEQIRSGLPERLSQAIKRCLAKEASRRFGSADELGSFVLGAGYSQVRVLESRPILPLILTFAALSVLLATGIWWLVRDPSPAPAQTTEMLLSSDSTAHSARYSTDGRRIAFIQAGEVWLQDNEQERSLTDQDLALESMELGGLAWVTNERLIFTAQGEGKPAQMELDLQSAQIRELVDHGAAADLSPDGKRLTFARRNRYGTWDIVVAQADGSRHETILAGDASRSFERPRWSPEGKRLALVVHQVGYQSTRDVGIWDLERGSLNMLTEDGISAQADNVDPCWAPGGEWIAYASRRSGTSSLWWVPAGGGASRPLSLSATEDQRHPDISPDGKRVLFNTLVKQLDLDLVSLEHGGGRPLTQKRRPDRFPAFSPDGQSVIYRSEGTGKHFDQHRIVTYDLSTNKRKTLAGPEGLRDFVHCGPDSLAFTATRGENRLLGLLDSSGKEDILLENYFRLWTPTCSPDGRSIVFVAQKERQDSRALWHYKRADGLARRLSADQGVHSYPVFSASGAKLAYRWSPSVARLGESELRLLSWPANDSSLAKQLTSHSIFRGSRRRLQFSGDGAWLYFMQSYSQGGRLWRIACAGGEPEKVMDLPHIHTFDFDISRDGKDLVYARANSFGNLHEARNEDWDL